MQVLHIFTPLWKERLKLFEIDQFPLQKGTEALDMNCTERLIRMEVFIRILFAKKAVKTFR